MGMRSDLLKQRHKKLQDIQKQGKAAFAYSFKDKQSIASIIEENNNLEPSETGKNAKIAGRLTALRQHGKVTFADLTDASGKIQLYLASDVLGEKYDEFADLDIGDIAGFEGSVFKTQRGELSLKVEKYTLLTKSLRPLPEKWHGLKDVETRFRQRYLDLLANPRAREIFAIREKALVSIRNYLNSEGFSEVDTPILQPLYGGATARPFITYHNALSRNLYLRIAPELYLKRLLIGNMEKVFELGRNFRNEGLSIKHNPEFTMLEAYQAYADYEDMMNLTENLLKIVVKEATGSLKITYQEKEIDFSNFKKIGMITSIKELGGVEVSFEMSLAELKKIAEKHEVRLQDFWGKGHIINAIFEKLVEPQLINPTFVTDFPVEVSPLARTSRKDKNLAERFELIIFGREVANAFSELTDPIEQRKRFEEQIKTEARDEVPQVIDEDFIKALEYGMPPAGGLGIGIDRLIMLITDSYSIKEVILFPHLRTLE
jgi:lysyl-tRNA synthetase class 2